MNKLKASILLLLSVLLLLAGTHFPRIVSAIEDNRILGQLSFSDIQPVQLEIQRDIPALGKLAMLTRMDNSIILPDSKVEMTREQVTDTIREQLLPYLEAGLISGIPQDTIEMEPALIQVSDTPELNGVIWMADFNQGSPFGYIQVAIDDETGKLLVIDCVPEQVREPVEYEEIMDTFAHIYFTALGIDDYWYYVTPSQGKDNYAGDSAICRVYSFADERYGEVTVRLYVYQNGFYVALFP